MSTVQRDALHTLANVLEATADAARVVAAEVDTVRYEPFDDETQEAIDFELNQIRALWRCVAQLHLGASARVQAIADRQGYGG